MMDEKELTDYRGFLKKKGQNFNWLKHSTVVAPLLEFAPLRD